MLFVELKKFALQTHEIYPNKTSLARRRSPSTIQLNKFYNIMPSLPSLNSLEPFEIRRTISLSYREKPSLIFLDLSS